MNSSGKVLVIFLVITAILLISLTAISLFFFQKETERRKLAETTLEEFQSKKAQAEKEIEELKRQNLVLEEKKKEAEARLDDLSDDLELEKGLREEMKLETSSLKEKLEESEKSKKEFDAAMKEKEEAAAKLKKELAKYETEMKQLNSQLKAETERNKKLSDLYEQKEQERQEEIARLKSLQSVPAPVYHPRTESGITDDPSGQVVRMGVELGEIIVNPDNVGLEDDPLHSTAGVPLSRIVSALGPALEGRILSVDIETEFVIVSLGENDGLSVGKILSVYRNGDYMGDIKVTRLQPEMSAADLVSPLSIRNIKKNDQVKLK